MGAGPAAARLLALGLAPGALLLAPGLPAAGAAPLPDCDDPRWVDVFQSGVRNCRGLTLQRSIAELEQVAHCRPRSELETTVAIAPGLRDVPYQPQFWLSLGYLRSGQVQRAVGPFELWSCAEEEQPIVTDELEALPGQAESQRPKRFVDYAEGLVAAEREEWAAAVTSFCKALRAWDEDREKVRGQGRWVEEAYRPRERLGRSLERLGCRMAAIALLRRSSRVQCRDAGEPGELESLENLLAALQRDAGTGAPEPDLCRRFECCLEVWRDHPSCPAR